MTDDLMEWLGPAAEHLTAEHIERVRLAASEIHKRYPDPDESWERDVARSAVVMYLLGETTPEQAAQALRSSRRIEQAAYIHALQVARELVRDQCPKKTAAEMVGVDRMSLLEALGERARR